MKQRCKKASKQINGLVDDYSAGSAELNYEKPVLIAYGDVRDVTLGATQGAIELGSGCSSGFTNGDVFDPC